MNTVLSIKEDRFLINGSLTYSEIKGCPASCNGLLMNARFIQGIFNDKNNIDRYNRFGRTFNVKNNTEQLINALPLWYSYGLRAITVGFQGGGACFTIDNKSVKNTPFSEDGNIEDVSYFDRMDKIIKAADSLGMIVIVSAFYVGQARFLKNNKAVETALDNICTWINKNKYTNIILEIANEQDLKGFEHLSIIQTEYGIEHLIKFAKSRINVPVGCSSEGRMYYPAIGEASDVILLHGNNICSSEMAYMIRRAKCTSTKKPIVFNEDSPAITRLEVAFDNGVSWGYYNNWTKQEPPTNWSIVSGADEFFAYRLANYLGIPSRKPSEEFHLEGCEPNESFEGKRYISLSALYPEKIQKVKYLLNGKVIGYSYDDPFFLIYFYNWLGLGYEFSSGDLLEAEIHLHDGTIKTINKVLK